MDSQGTWWNKTPVITGVCGSKGTLLEVSGLGDGAVSRNRTADPRITNALLYQLS